MADGMSSYKSRFAAEIAAMMEYRVALGMSANTLKQQMRRFDGYCAEHCPECDEISKELVFNWLGELFEEGAVGLSSYASAIRQLAEYMNAVGKSAYVLPTGFYPYKSGFTAYIFTDKELSALFSAIDSLSPNGRSNEAIVAPVLFRLIYTCGLRPNEGRELKRKNVNLENSEIMITETKKKKDRLVVMSPDMLKLCREFDAVLSQERKYFFPQANGKAFTASQVYGLIKKCWRNANPGIENLPTVRTYDLRHRFASARLNLWLDEGANLNNKLIYLMVYMGHDTIGETRYYVHILLENLLKSAGIDWDALNSVIPEVSRWR
jgi:integrase